MKKSIMKKGSTVLALILAGALTACSGGGSQPESGLTDAASDSTEAGAAAASDTSVTPVKDLVTYQLLNAEMGTFNMLYTSSYKELMVLANCVDSLLSNDNHSNLVPGLAETWEHDGSGKVWTFHLRDTADWVDYQGNYKADVVAEDFLWSMEWVLNYHKNESVNTTVLLSMIEGAQEYYDYTESLEYDEAMELDLTKFKELVTGVQAPDEHTVVYTCTYANTYFDTLCSSWYLVPLSGGILEELGGAENYKAVSYNTLWYCGPYTITTYVQNNEKVLTKNPTYWDESAQLFDTVTVKMLESDDIAYQMYRNGELDYCKLSESAVSTLKNGNDPFSDYICGRKGGGTAGSMHLNWYKLLEDGSEDYDWNTAVANEAFRKSLYWGLDWTGYYARTNVLDPLSLAWYIYTPAGLAFTSDGTDYSDLVMAHLDYQISDDVYSRYDTEKALAYKKQAMEELTAKGVTFPIHVVYHITASNQTELDTANILKQMFTKCLGEDYINFDIQTYISSFPKEIRAYGIHGMTINSNGADYGDPYTFLSTETYGEGSYWANRIARVDQIKDPELIAVFQEFTDKINAANAITDDVDQRLEAFAEAEAYGMDHAIIWPMLTGGGSSGGGILELTRINDYSRISAPYGVQDYRYVNWETNVDGYTTEDYKRLLAEYEEGR